MFYLVGIVYNKVIRLDYFNDFLILLSNNKGVKLKFVKN